MKNIHYQSTTKLSPWRKISMSTWKPTGDSSCYALEDINVEEMLFFCEKNEISISTFLAKAIGKTLEFQPKINSTIRFGRIIERKDISVFFHMADTIFDDLSGVLISEPQKKSISELENEIKQQKVLYKEGKNQFIASKNQIKILPVFLVKFILNLYSFFAYQLNFNLPIFNMPKNAFGSVMLTSVGSLGIQKALCPIAPYTKVPMVISFGEINERVVVENNEMIIRKCATFGFTFDHRIMDGLHFSEFKTQFFGYIKNPNTLL